MKKIHVYSVKKNVMNNGNLCTAMYGYNDLKFNTKENHSYHIHVFEKKFSSICVYFCC